MKANFFYFKKLLVLLRAQTIVGGLEISDVAVKFARFDGREWQMVSLRLLPGIVKAGKVLNFPEFVETLSRLRSQIPGGKSRQKISVAVSISSLNVYTQVVNLPTLEESKLDEAVRLNAQMVSTSNPEEIYFGWQIVGENETEKKLDVLSAFIKKAAAEEFGKALREAGFLPVALESRAMALARLARERGVEIDKNRSYVVLILDNEVLDFLVIRQGQLYFEYPNYWRDIKGEGKLISLLEFRTTLIGNLRRVLNFYSQHWSDQPEAVIVVASGLNNEIKKIINTEFSLTVKNLELRLDRAVEADWFGVLGSGLRGIMKRKEDRDISLLGTTARDEFRIEQIVSFMRFWRVMLPVAALLLMGFLVASYFVFSGKYDSLRKETPVFDAMKMDEVTKLQEEANAFNRLVELVGLTKKPEVLKVVVLDKIKNLVTDHSINLIGFSFGAFNSPVTIFGTASSQERILEFRKSLEADTQIKDVKLPLTEIKPTSQGFSFSMSFTVASPIAE